jgi:outer membrane protein assembly factor BamB
MVLLIGAALVAGNAPGLASASASSRQGPGAALVTPAPERAKWRFKLNADYSMQSPGIGADGTIYVAMSNGKLYAVNPDGTQKWLFQAGLGGGVFGPVAVGAEDTIYVAGMVPNPNGSGNTGGIFAMNPDGTQKWLFDGMGAFAIAGPSIGSDGNTYAVTDILGIGLFSLTPAGELRWNTGRFSEYGQLGQQIAFGPNQLYFAFDMYAVGPPSLFAYDFNGNKKFQTGSPADDAQPDVGPNGNVVVEDFFSNQGLSLSAYTPTGSAVWSFYEFPGNTQGHPDVAIDNRVLGSQLSTLLAVNPDGTEKWRYVDPTIMFEPVARPANDLVFMGGRITYGKPGHFQAVDTNGVNQWRVDLPDEPGFTPYGQLVPMTRPVFSPDGNTAYGVTDVAGDGANPYSFLYAIDLSPSVPSIPAAPSNLQAKGRSHTQIAMRWTDNSSNETGFKIEWCTGLGCTNFVQIATVAANMRTYTDTGLVTRTTLRVPGACLQRPRRLCPFEHCNRPDALISSGPL